MQHLIYTKTAANDLTAVYEYIALDSKEMAFRYMAEQETAIKQLQDFPESGSNSRYPELQAQKIRILPHDKYLIFYKYDKSNIYIIRVLHGAKNYIKLF